MSPSPAHRDHRRTRRAASLAGAVALAATSLACTRPGHHPHPTTTTSTTTTSTTTPVANAVGYELANFTITLTSGHVLAGANTVTVTNVGTAPHEIIFVKAAGAASLPTNDNGSVEEDAIPADDLLGEIEVPSGSTATEALTFTPGSWVAFCNVGTHFARGMHVDFTVS